MAWEDKKREYMNGYVKKNVLYKNLNFSRSNPEDMEIWEWLKAYEQTEGKVAPYIKALIRADMLKKNS